MAERNLIEKIEKIIHSGLPNLLGNNEDAVAFRVNQGNLVVNVDAWVSSTDRIPGFTPFDCGFRAAINSMSDIYAKGGIPQVLLASIGIPDSEKEDIVEIVKGIQAASQKYETFYLGGDLNQSTDLFIDITVIGTVDNLRTRSGAKPGDLVYWLGPLLGENSVAFGILLEGWQGDKNKAYQVLSNPYLFPEFSKLPATAAIDCSDGLARSLHILARASRVGIKLELPQIVSEFVESTAKINQKKISDLILFGGEELGIVFTAPRDSEIPILCMKIGTITDSTKIEIKNEEIPDKGWDHFSSPESL